MIHLTLGDGALFEDACNNGMPKRAQSAAEMKCGWNPPPKVEGKVRRTKGM